MTLTIEGILSTKNDAEVTPTKPKPGLTREEWREYQRRNYVRELRRCRIRIWAGWTESAAEHWEIKAAYSLTLASIACRTITKGVTL
jgi:hypothetical protein